MGKDFNRIKDGAEWDMAVDLLLTLMVRCRFKLNIGFIAFGVQVSTGYSLKVSDLDKIFNMPLNWAIQ